MMESKSSGTCAKNFLRIPRPKIGLPSIVGLNRNSRHVTRAEKPIGSRKATETAMTGCQDHG